MLDRILISKYKQFEAQNPLPNYVRSAIRLLMMCRTEALGGHMLSCPDNHVHRAMYNSCGHRFCPKCAFRKIEQWLDKQRSRLLSCDHYHVIFTIPSELNELWLSNVKVMSGLLFRSVSRTLLELLEDDKYLGARPGIIATLHTWGRTLILHPHIHCLVTGGGLTRKNEWREVGNGFLLPVRVVMPVFRGKLRDEIRCALRRGELALPPGIGPQQMENLLNKLGRKKWNVNIRSRHPESADVLTYLGRYIRGGPIGKSRFVSVSDDSVVFRYRDHRDFKEKIMRLSIRDFLRRFLLHVPAPGAHYVRSYGVYANASTEALARCREHLGQLPTKAPDEGDNEANRPNRHAAICPVCGKLMALSAIFRGWPRVAFSSA